MSEDTNSIDQQDSQAQPLGGPTAADLGQDRGYIGDRADLHPFEAYSQETDPTKSPSASATIAGSQLRGAADTMSGDPEAADAIGAALDTLDDSGEDAPVVAPAPTPVESLERDDVPGAGTPQTDGVPTDEAPPVPGEPDGDTSEEGAGALSDTVLPGGVGPNDDGE